MPREAEKREQTVRKQHAAKVSAEPQDRLSSRTVGEKPTPNALSFPHRIRDQGGLATDSPQP